MWRCGGVPYPKNYSLPSSNEEYYTTTPQCKTLRSRTLCWFAYVAASRVCRRSVFLPSIVYRINIEVIMLATSVTDVSKCDLLLQSLFSHIFAMASSSKCFHASGLIGSARGPLFSAEYALTFFVIFATYFTFWPVSRKWESAKWDLSIGNATYTLEVKVNKKKKIIRMTTDDEVTSESALVNVRLSSGSLVYSWLYGFKK